MIKAFIYSKFSIGDKLIQEVVQKQLGDIDTEYLGERVDLSKIKPVEQNLIIVVNKSLFKVDLDKIIGYIRKDLTKPLVVVKRVRTFGTVAFSSDRKISEISTNKIFLFAGVLFVRKEDLKNTMGEVFRNLNVLKDEGKVRVYII